MLPSHAKNIDISDQENHQNREDKFNRQYHKLFENSILFDKAKLRIGQSRKDKEFCDILELSDNMKVKIIEVKKYGGCSSINYLFSQTRFYCEAFLSDEVFLADIREFINKSNHKDRAEFLYRIKPDISDVSGKDYDVCLWFLYDKNQATPPSRTTLPIMAQYEIKLTYERLRNVYKFNSVTLTPVPVTMAKFTSTKSNK